MDNETLTDTDHIMEVKVVRQLHQRAHNDAAPMLPTSEPLDLAG